MAFLRGPTNFVNDMLYSNCSRPFYIYLLTALPALVESWLLVRFWDFGDIVRATATTAAGGKYPKRGRKRHTRLKSGRPLPGADPERKYRQGLKWLLTITQPLEYIGFVLLLYEAIDRFYLRWAMYLDDADACINPGFYGPLIRRVTDGVAHPNSGGNTVQLPDLIFNGGNWPSSSLSASLPIGRFKAVFAVTIIGPGGGATYNLSIRATNIIGSGDFKSESRFCPEGVECDLIADADLFFPLVTGGEVQWVISGPPVPVGLVVTKADIYIQRRQQAFDPPA